MKDDFTLKSSDKQWSTNHQINVEYRQWQGRYPGDAWLCRKAPSLNIQNLGSVIYWLCVHLPNNSIFSFRFKHFVFKQFNNEIKVFLLVSYQLCILPVAANSPLFGFISIPMLFHIFLASFCFIIKKKFNYWQVLQISAYPHIHRKLSIFKKYRVINMKYFTLFYYDILFS